ncbi:ABC transporter substrate-binding protein [Halomarina halobia]|uniref:ABC transporter substrate-binding protein n=1 Tax=Halomarina halobia TaxID=3033386 RepID=A0ABD6AFL3_9EURY|nr:ABC transporter substrate-binding protein [Halomarina sp. PSR21]
MGSENSSHKSVVSRRRLIQALGASGTISLAGCMGGDGSGSGGGNLGERVPTVTIEYWSNLGGLSKIMEDSAPIMKNNLEKRLGITVEVKPVEFTTQINNTIQDKRTHHIGFWYHTNTPDRLDPQEMTRRYCADWAGGNGQANPPNYASCEYTDPAVGQGNASSEEERQELVTKAHSIMSEDLSTLPIFPNYEFGAVRTDSVTLNAVGEAGVTRTNPHIYIQSETDMKQIASVDTPVAMETGNYPIIDSSGAQAIWNHLVTSTLTEYDENFELQDILAKTYEIEDDAKRITVELKDATFHNGDPVTAEDVKFTYKQLWDHPGAYPQASSPDYESINVVDDKTTEFVFNSPYLPLIQKVWPRWGIMHKSSWERGGAPDNAEGFDPDTIIGAGPFAIREFSIGSHLDLVPHDGHPVHKPGHELFLQAYRNEQTAVQAFRANEVQLAPNLSPGSIQNIENDLGDVAKTVSKPGFMPFILYPQQSWSPGQFREFRAAVGAAIDRKRMSATALRGAAEPQLYSCPLMDAHPARPEKSALTKMAPAEGSEDKARKALSDAGWGWDGSGRLHYPADKDLSPPWPAEGVPDPGDFPCLNEDNEYVRPE